MSLSRLELSRGWSRVSGRADLFDLYVRQLPRAGTLNERNRLRIALENRMTPAEAWRLRAFEAARRPWPVELLGALRRSASGRAVGLLAALEQRALDALQPDHALRAESQAWAMHLRGLIDNAGLTLPEPFVRQRIGPSMALYREPDGPGAKALTIVFTGRAQRPMMPLPVFLQHLRARETDVLVLWDPSRRDYRLGVPGSTSSPTETVALLRHLSERGRYARLATIGTSAGGLSALLAGMSLGAAAAVSVGGARHNPEGQPAARAPAGVDLGLLRGRGARTRLVHVHGSASRRDADNAAWNCALFGGEICGVRDDHEDVRHNALIPLVRNGRFEAFLADKLFGAKGGHGEGACNDASLGRSPLR